MCSSSPMLLLLSCFSHVRHCATPQTAAHQAPLSLGFSRQEYWSGLPFPSPMHESEKWKWSCSVVSDSSRPCGLQPTRLLGPWDFPGKSTGVGCHCLLWSSIRTPKLQLTAKQPSTGEFGSHHKKKKKIPHVQGQRRSPSKRVEGTESCLELNLTRARDTRRAQTKPCMHQDPETPGFPYLPAFCSTPPWVGGGGVVLSPVNLSDNSFLSVSPLSSPFLQQWEPSY